MLRKKKQNLRLNEIQMFISHLYLCTMSILLTIVPISLKCFLAFHNILNINDENKELENV